MPSLGADMENGTLLEWLVAPGDPVHRGEVVAVVDTEKAAIEVECFDDGVIEELKVQPGESVPVGAVLASIGPAGATVSAPGRDAAPPSPTPPAVAPIPAEAEPARVLSPLVRREAAALGVDLAALEAASTGGVVHRLDVEQAAPPRARRTGGPSRTGRVRASPRARRLAGSAGIDLSTVTGSGTDGVVVTRDIEARAAGADTVSPATPSGPTERGGRTAPERHTSMRQAIGALMARSKREIPHYYLTHTVDVAATVDRLHRRNRDLPVEQRLVPAAFLLAATVRALEHVPELNGTWVDGRFVPSDRVDLGLVISLRSGGIIVPVITDAAALPAEKLMPVMRDLTARARNGRLRGSELTAPSITVTNLGEQGVDSVLGVIYPPQVALVGFGAVAERPWAVDGLLGVRPVVTMTLAADHRASDGAVGARLLNRIGALLQRPEEL